jgi:hypothetical protein
MKANVPQLTNKQLRALHDEVNRQTAKNVQNLSQNLQAMVLWALHEHLGFGKKRLLRFQKAFLPLIQELQEFYLAENAADTEFICKYRLRHDCGVNVEELSEMFPIKVKTENGEGETEK